MTTMQAAFQVALERLLEAGRLQQAAPWVHQLLVAVAQEASHDSVDLNQPQGDL